MFFLYTSLLPNILLTSAAAVIPNAIPGKYEKDNTFNTTSVAASSFTPILAAKAEKKKAVNATPTSCKPILIPSKYKNFDFSKFIFEKNNFKICKSNFFKNTVSNIL